MLRCAGAVQLYSYAITPVLCGQPPGAATRHHCATGVPWTPKLFAALNHYHIYGGRKIAAESPGAWLYLRDALDVADTERFPEATYGTASLSNAARVRKIVAAFADRGAAVEDMTAATSARHGSRKRFGYNSAGWRVWDDNYGQWMTQRDARATSIGRWQVGGRNESLLGHSARATDSATGKHTMTFDVNNGVFADTTSGSELYVRVGAYDEGTGGWELGVASDAQRGKTKSLGRVTKADTKRWVEVRVSFRLGADLSAHGLALSLTDVDGVVPGERGATRAVDDDTFAWIEVSKLPFAFNITDVVVKLAPPGEE